MYRLILYCLIVVVAGSCSVQKHLPKGERIYRGSVIKVEKEKGVKATDRSLRRQLQLAARPQANKFLLGHPYKVWWWYLIGEPKRPKGIRAYFKRRLGEAPVLSGKVNAKVSAENMQSFLSNRGFFHSTVTGDTTNSGYFTKTIYKAHVFPQYIIRNINWLNDSSELVKLLQENQQEGILKVGNGYRLSDLQAERDRLDGIVKAKGYYYFSPDYIVAYVDSTVGNNQVDLILSIRQSTPENARHIYKIDRITVFPNYTLLLPPPDTSKQGTFNVDGLLIRDTLHKFKSSVFKNVITYRPGMIYSSRDQNTTLNRFINLGTFKFARNRFEPTKDSTDPYHLNVFYYLTPAKKKSVQAQLSGFSKENKFLGTQLNLSWRNRNTFGGAELLTVRAYGALELSFTDLGKAFTNYRGGLEASINFPHYVVPFLKIKEKNQYPPHTRLLLGYELFRKQLFYSKTIFRAQYEFNWKQSTNKQYGFAPITFSYISAGHLTDSFRNAMLINPKLKINVNDEILLGSFYSYTFNTANPFAKNQWYFMGSVDLAGNVAGLVTGAKQAREYNIFQTPFAQYAKADVDLRYQKKLNNNLDWVNRFQIGVGLPYNNSNILPFSKQYIIGGGSSLRGFRYRKIGPGSYLPTLNDQRYYQVIGGDYRLQINSELRIPLFGRFSAAVFIDAGNTWTKDTLLFGMAGKLKKDFYKELAVSGGFGVRADAGIVLLRVDIGFPLRTPYLPEGQRWVFDKVSFVNREWREQNLIINIALGYPF